MSDRYTIRLTLESDTLTGSGEGFGAVIDNDIVFDELGLPYIPAKRIKGCLRQSAEEVNDMLVLSNLSEQFNLDEVFGKQGSEESAPVFFHNLYLEDYDNLRSWLKYYLNQEEWKQFLSPEIILDYFTILRQQTAIDEEKGKAKEHSLRTSRVLRKGISFVGEINFWSEDKRMIEVLSLACRNLRYIGTRRNRGFGKIKCKLLKNDSPISSEILEETE
ncbi:RAMP superfamily CRISPR-associated protein [Calditrichota bacterium GD2]